MTVRRCFRLHQFLEFDRTIKPGGVYELDAMKRYADLGAHFILTGSDHAYILAGASLRSAFFRKLEADRKAS